MFYNQEANSNRPGSKLTIHTHETIATQVERQRVNNEFWRLMYDNTSNATMYRDLHRLDQQLRAYS